ncbi:MAG TPA: thiopeptide-type bacteriocin biosynthesis protein, partial [Polyangia bacterium]|nr:thiopeptide-type bacteriocin biosynthesis protein [Polyangia bacterium]
LAGVCVGELGPKTEIATGRPAPHLAPSWARVDALAQALLHEPAIRDRVRLRAAPSVWTDGAVVNWVGGREEFYGPCTADLDGAALALAAVLAATTDWAPWPAVRARAQSAQPEAGDLDELLRALVYDGLLQSDLSPPLIGPPPASYLRDQLAALGRQSEARALDEARGAFEAGDLARGRALWTALPGRAAHDVTAVLTLHARKTPRLERVAVERAARLVPLLCRLQAALAPPLAERFAARAWNDAFDAVTEIFGAGAFALGPLAAGDYGVDVEDANAGAVAEASVGAAPPALLVLLCDAIVDAARTKRREAKLDLTALEDALGDLEGTPLPPTAELFLVPAPRRPGAPAGTGWLLGLHAPAGASLGRFLHALGAPLVEACAEIAAAERRLRPEEERVDVAFAPSAALADLGTHPPIRPRALALSRWSAAGGDLAVGDLELEADPSDAEGLTLRASGPTTIVPSPLLRARSATAAPGAAQLLVGWSLQRQHAPWAFTPGPLADLAFLPRIVVEGFVIAPASWRLPPALRQGGRPAGAGRALGRWRRAAGVPRMVQVGEGDELYPVDLQAPGAAAELAPYDRVFEIWPPLESVVDRDGRRVEVIVAVVDEGVDETAPPAPCPGRVPPPRQEPPLAGWRTFKLFGAAARQDSLLIQTILPAVTDARAAAEIDGWFFLRYLDGPGARPHLRLRAHARDGAPAVFEQRLRRALESARASGTIASLETGDYFPERGRFFAGDLAAVHAIFESDSEAVSALLADPELDRVPALPLLFDALARGLGLDLAARHALGRERRRAAEAWTRLDAEERKESDALFRHHARPLRAALGAAPAATPLLADHEARVAAAAGSLTETDRARLLPTLLHLSAVRLIGPDPDAERLGYTFWERTLEGLRRSR